MHKAMDVIEGYVQCSMLLAVFVRIELENGKKLPSSKPSRCHLPGVQDITGINCSFDSSHEFNSTFT